MMASEASSRRAACSRRQGFVPAQLFVGPRLLRHVVQGEHQVFHAPPVVQDRVQRPVPIGDAPFGMIGVSERLGLHLERLPAPDDLPEDGLVLPVGKEFEMIVPGEIVDLPPAGLRVGLVDPDEVEVSGRG